MNRRQFLKSCAWGLTMASLGPAMTWEPALAATPRQPILVALHLVGGNDALNTLVPLRQPLYRKLRPQLAISSRDLAGLTPEWGLNPALGGLRGLYERGRLALVMGVGRPDHDRSHFRSSDLWQTAGHPDDKSGWLGLLARRHQLASVSVGDVLARALFAAQPDPLAFHGEALPELPGEAAFQAALKRMYSHGGALGRAGEKLFEVVDDYRARCAAVRLATKFPDNPTGHRLELTARMLAAGLPPRIFHVAVGDFDTHEAQRERQGRSLGELDAALCAFWAELERLGLDRRVLVLGYSEFGRRVRENASGGTDHGAGGLAFLLGGGVRGGVHGQVPDLGRLRDGDLEHQWDYRSLYATVLEGHFGPGAAAHVVPGYDPIAGLLEKN